MGDVLCHPERKKSKTPRSPYAVDSNQQLKDVIGRRIRHTRERAGQSITKLALAAGISVSFLSRIEHGHNIPSLQTLHRISIALKTPIASLVNPNLCDR